MSARIAPKTDTIGIAFSPHLPRFTRPKGRKNQNDPQTDRPTDDEPENANGGSTVTQLDESLPAETIFEAGLLGNEQALAPPTAYEYIQRLKREWSSPLSTLPVTDKII
ncbi:hypothetical protein ASG47_15445 [Devosia sp. Leaf420]|uniref:hypothetical protein n=1 Tax=Devosia sp. Leaf420 TaxID=1736374 RepID=UPI000714D1EA|nr:hypothetical protein [Devosia sp. Leaf420]KQT44825.1 hypothetical protein ASG47_15445 [Devosia sp. Leaf420]